MLGFMIGSLLSMVHYAVGKVFWPGTWVGASFNCIPQFGGAGDYSSINGVVVWILCLGGAVVYATGWQGCHHMASCLCGAIYRVQQSGRALQSGQ